MPTGVPRSDRAHAMVRATGRGLSQADASAFFLGYAPAVSAWRRWAAGCALVAFVSALVLAAATLAGWFFIDAIGVAELPLFPLGGRWTVVHDLEKANRNAYAVPADGSLREDRVLAFFRVRRAMHAAYEAHRSRQDALAELWRWGVIQARAQHLAAERMSEAEYTFIASALLDLCPAQDAEEARRGHERLLSQFNHTSGLPEPSPLPFIPRRAAWSEAADRSNMAMAATHRAALATFGDIEAAWPLRPDGQQPPCWARAAEGPGPAPRRDDGRR